MNVLITGATGAVGPRVVQALCSAGRPLTNTLKISPWKANAFRMNWDLCRNMIWTPAGGRLSGGEGNGGIGE